MESRLQFVLVQQLSCSAETSGEQWTRTSDRKCLSVGAKWDKNAVRCSGDSVSACTALRARPSTSTCDAIKWSRNICHEIEKKKSDHAHNGPTACIVCDINSVINWTIRTQNDPSASIGTRRMRKTLVWTDGAGQNRFERRPAGQSVAWISLRWKRRGEARKSGQAHTRRARCDRKAMNKSNK